MEAVGELEGLRKEEKCNNLIQNKNTSHFFNAFECFYVNTKLKLKSNVAMGISQLSRSMTSDQITSDFINFSLDLIFSDFPRKTTLLSVY